MHLKVHFFRQKRGKEPVRAWLKSLPPEDRKLIGEDIKTVQWGWPLGMPLVRILGNGLWEIRTDLSEKTARVIFCVSDDHLVLLHGFIKKTRKTLKKDLELARQRLSRLGDEK
jgi:phage-related protein